MPMHRWIASAAGGTSQRLKPARATVCSLLSPSNIAIVPSVIISFWTNMSYCFASVALSRTNKNKLFFAYSMLKVHIRPHWEISFNADPPLDTATLLALLLGIHDSGSIADAARNVGLSYRYAWGLLR